MNRFVFVVMLVSLSACGVPDERTAGRPAPSASPAPTPSETASGSVGLYEANATVLDDGKSGPKLCLGGIATSYPPQCGDVPVLGWDWADVTGEERASGVTWGGEYHVVGSFDGDTFELTKKPGPPAEHLQPIDDFSSDPACEEPPGGWITEGEGIDQQAAGRVLQAIQNDPEYAAGWMTQLAPTTDDRRHRHRPRGRERGLHRTRS